MRDFHTATVADNAFVLYALVFAAVTLPITSRAKDLLAEEATLLGFECAVVKGLGVFDFAAAPGPNGLWCSDSDSHTTKCIRGIHAENFSDDGTMRIHGLALLGEYMEI
jgi:hypothetical protein